MVLIYKCKSCGSDMSYDIKKGLLKCRRCGVEKSVPEAEAERPLDETTSASEQAGEFHCPSCGAPLKSDGNTASLSCAFCGTPAILTPRVTGQNAPRYLIPFRFDKAEATERYKKWCRFGLVTPSGMMDKAHIEALSGEYVPFFLYNVNANTKLNAKCTNTRVWRLGDNEYTEISFYDVYRDMDLGFLKIPADASERMNDALMDLLEPYDYSGLSDFKMPFLSGFFSEKFNFPASELFPRIRRRVNEYCEKQARSTISGYGTVSVISSQTDAKSAESAFALLPVYSLSFTYKNKPYLFAMNGQTGKISGKPPISKLKVGLWFAGLTGLFFGLIRAVNLLI